MTIGVKMTPESLASNEPLCRDSYKAFKAAEAVIRRNSRTFYFATAFLSSAKRRAIRALYAFCRMADDLVDVQGATLEEVERFREQARLPASQQSDPVLYAWALTREQFQVDLRYQEELISGVSFDLIHTTYANWEQLQDYCYHVASTVGLLSIPVIGLQKNTSFKKAAPFAIQLGIALQLTNILRDIGEDARHGRVYLPEEDLRRFHLSPADILQGIQNQQFVNLLKFEIERTRALYWQAIPGISLLSSSGQLAVGAAALLYRAILDEIEAIQYRVYQVRAHTSGLKKLALLPGIIKTVLSLQPPA
jgi:15-cis-phytoene synthase